MIRKMQTAPVSPDRPAVDHSAHVALNLQRLTEEHDRLQIRTSKLQKQLSDTVSDYETRIRSLEEENGEVRGNLEFISLERNVLSEMVTELEEALKREKEVCKLEKESLRDLASRSQVTQRDIALKDERIASLEEQVGKMEEELSRLQCQERNRKSLIEQLITAWTETDSLLPSDSPGRKAASKPCPENETDLIEAVRDHRIALRTVVEENKSLKSELSALVQDNMRMQSVMKERSESEKSKLIEAQLREELRDEKERVSGLMDEMDVLKERLRCAEVVSNELKKQVKEMSIPSSAGMSGPAAAAGSCGQQLTTQSAVVVNNNPVVLRQELKSVREVIAAREAMIKSLNDKYVRHRQVWEENERRANDEIKKLDEIIDRVVLTLSDCGPFVGSCPALKRLFDDLTRDQQISVTTLSSTIV